MGSKSAYLNSILESIALKASASKGSARRIAQLLDQPKYFAPESKTKLTFTAVSDINAQITGARPQPLLKLAIGRVVPEHQTAVDPQTVRVRIMRLELNRDIYKFYYVRERFWALDERKQSTLGDLVLVRAAERPLRFNTVYRLERVLFKAGALVDPVTGARSLGPVFELDAHRRLAASYAARYGHGRPSAVPAASEQVLPEGLRPEDVDAELEQWASDATDL